MKFSPHQFEGFGEAGGDEHHNLSTDSAQQWVLSSKLSLTFAPLQSGFGISRFGEQFVSDRLVPVLHSTGQQSVVPDYIEIVRRNVLNQLPDELDRA